jgi:hypothetical protein
MAWFSFRVDSLTDFFKGVRSGLAAELDRPIKLGVGPRSAAFVPLCGYYFSRLAAFMELLLPKHYFFHRGFELCVVKGMPAHLAADEMGISLHTIRSYIKEGYRILEAYDGTEYPSDMSPQERAFMRLTRPDAPEEE